MESENLGEKLCSGSDTYKEEDSFSRVEKVLAPFMRTLKKRNHEKADVLSTEYEELYLNANTKDLIKRLQTVFTDPLELRSLLNETAELLKVVTKSKSVNLYLTDYDNMELMLCPKFYLNNPRFRKKYKIGTYLAAYVALTKEYVISSDILGDVRFPQGIPDVPVVKSAICLPIITNDEENCIGVIELYRECSDRAYDLTNLQICNALTAWMGIAVEQSNNKLRLIKEQEINRQLSDLANLYFSGIAPFNKILSDFIKVAKIAVNAQRGAFYIFREPVAQNSQETLWADAYEEGLDENNDTTLYKMRDRLKFVVNKPGIPGYAARTGEMVNILDAYKDYRFDRKSDSPFYRTRSVVAMPIKDNTGVMGVLCLINSLSSSSFSKDAVELIRSFSSYFVFICGHFYLENTLSKLKLRLQVSDKLLEYHSRPPPDELNTFKSYFTPDMTFPPGFLKFDWDLTGNDEDILKAIGAIFTSAANQESCFDAQHLADFILRVKKSYAPVIYHNFDHAVFVLHFAFLIIHKNKEFFTNDEVIAILLVAYCHDVGHTGFTNSFLTLKNDALYKLYGEFCGEMHRFEYLLYLIQQTELFSGIPEHRYQTIVKSIKKLILSFDFTILFETRIKVTKLINANEFNWEDPEHRFFCHTILLACCDNALSFKSFEVARKHTVLFYKELQKQGDLEKSMGFAPLPMLNRNNSDLLSENQVIYLRMVVMPCVDIIVHLLPNLTVIKELIEDTISKWDELVLLRGREVWKVSQALVFDKRERKLGHRVTLVSTVSSIKTIISDTKSF